jgi:hAT family C-terminal dimerisation region
MLAIPASSAECERIFSSAKMLITASRNGLHPDVIEANEYLRSWFGKPEKVDKQSMNQDQDCGMRGGPVISEVGNYEESW